MLISKNCFPKVYNQELTGLELEISALAVDFMFAVIALLPAHEKIVCASMPPGQKSMHMYWHSMQAQIREVLGEDAAEALADCLSEKLRSLPLQDSLEESIRRSH